MTFVTENVFSCIIKSILTYLLTPNKHFVYGSRSLFYQLLVSEEPFV